MLKLKLQYFGHLMRRINSLEKTLMLGKMKAGGEGDNQGWLDGITDSMYMNLSKPQEMVKDREAWCADVYGLTKLDMSERLDNNNCTWERLSVIMYSLKHIRKAL